VGGWGGGGLGLKGGCFFWLVWGGGGGGLCGDWGGLIGGVGGNYSWGKVVASGENLAVAWPVLGTARARKRGAKPLCLILEEAQKLCNLSSAGQSAQEPEREKGHSIEGTDNLGKAKP